MKRVESNGNFVLDWERGRYFYAELDGCIRVPPADRVSSRRSDLHNRTKPNRCAPGCYVDCTALGGTMACSYNAPRRLISTSELWTVDLRTSSRFPSARHGPDLGHHARRAQLLLPSSTARRRVPCLAVESRPCRWSCGPRPRTTRCRYGGRRRQCLVDAEYVTCTRPPH